MFWNKPIQLNKLWILLWLYPVSSEILLIPNFLSVLAVDVPLLLLCLTSSFAASAILAINKFICSSVQSEFFKSIPAIAVQYSSLLPSPGYIIVNAEDKAILPTSKVRLPWYSLISWYFSHLTFVFDLLCKEPGTIVYLFSFRS